MSLFAEYIKEREGLDTIENENGFISFAIRSDLCFVRDLFIKKTARQLGYARMLYGQLLRLARDAKCSKLVCHVDTRAQNAAHSLEIILSRGFHVADAQGGVITLEKELA